MRNVDQKMNAPVGIGVLDGPKTIRFLLAKDRFADLCDDFLIFKTVYAPRTVGFSLRLSLQIKIARSPTSQRNNFFVPILGNRTKMGTGAPVEQRKTVPMHFAKLRNGAKALPVSLTQTFC